MQPHDAAVYRWDYAKFIFRGPVDLCEHYKHLFVQVIAAGDEYDGKESGYKAVPLRKHADGQWTYIYEIHGPLAQVVRYLDWKAWSPLASRLDIRWECDVTTNGVHALRKQLEDGGSGGRNIHTFNSRIRTKKDGRDAGGFGLALGSHKSELRFSAYKRGSEHGACEFQISGKKVSKGVAAIEMLRGDGDNLAEIDPWTELRTRLCVSAVREFKKSTAVGLEELCTMLRTGMSDTPVESALREIERQVERLDKTGLRVAQALVQERLALDFA